MNIAFNHHSSFLKNCFSVRCLHFSSIIFSVNPNCRNYSSENLTNPLLGINELPKYRKIKPEHVSDGVPHLVKEVHEKFGNFEKHLGASNYTWDNVITDSETISDELGLAWGAVSHLHSVKNTPLLRDTYQKVLPEVVALFSKLSQSRPVFEALKSLDGNKQNLDGAQQRIIESSLRAAKNAGVHLEGKEKEEFNKIVEELAELSTKFMNNVLDSTKNFSYLVQDKNDLDGLPSTVLSLLAANAGTELSQTIDPTVGPWKLSLDIPCYEPVMKHCSNRALREMLYKEYVTRASVGNFDNSDFIEKIRKLRFRKADILGFNNFAELSLSKKMAKTPSAVWDMIDSLREKARPVAEVEIKQLQVQFSFAAVYKDPTRLPNKINIVRSQIPYILEPSTKKFASDNGFEGELKNWDLAFWSERQREQLLKLNEEQLREYFPFQRVLHGLFSLAEELFDIKIAEVEDKSVETWHDDVKYFNVLNLQGKIIASFFLDPYSRPGEKQGGAWMNTALDRNDALHRKPVAYLVCNQSPPTDSTPSLMTYREVLTLFHEFGHGLQHMLTDVKYPSAAGINNVEWDAVELPSQFMENWLYDWSTVKQISSHFKTGESLPYSMFEQICKGRTYHTGMSTLRQLYFSALDIHLHTSDDHWRDVMKKVSKEYTIMEPIEEDSFPCSFLHIFSSSYAAGYYSYKWAEVLSADAFSAFEEVGLGNRDKVSSLGRRFRDTVLSKGGSKHPEEIFVEFRGRKANVNALLKAHGLQ